MVICCMHNPRITGTSERGTLARMRMAFRPTLLVCDPINIHERCFCDALALVPIQASRPCSRSFPSALWCSNSERQ